MKKKHKLNEAILFLLYLNHHQNIYSKYQTIKKEKIYHKKIKFNISRKHIPVNLQHTLSSINLEKRKILISFCTFTS